MDTLNTDTIVLETVMSQKLQQKSAIGLKMTIKTLKITH